MNDADDPVAHERRIVDLVNGDQVRGFQPRKGGEEPPVPPSGPAGASSTGHDDSASAPPTP